MKISSTLSCLLLLCSLPVVAQVNDSDFRALAKERKNVEIEALARARIAKENKDDVALWYLARVAAGDAKKRNELIPRLEQCVKDLPNSARCYHALGSLYGSAAMSGGMTAGLKYAGSIKEMFLKAVELDPKNTDMRRDLNQFYLQAPGIAGGSVRKAIANADEFSKINLPAGQLLRAEIHSYEKEWEKAEALLNTIKPGSDDDLSGALSNAWTSLGFAQIEDKRHAQALSLFEKRIAADPKNAANQFGLGRALLEGKQVDAAIAAMERALQIDEKLAGHYRLGLAYQTRGDKPKAVAAFQKFLSYRGTGKAADDARERITQLQRG